MARTIAAGATWRPLLTDPHTGELLARGTTTYRPPAALAGAVIDRDTTCTFPGCRIPAHRCDIDHITPFDHDRPAEHQTTAGNLHTICRHHHRLKTEGHWTPVRDPATGITTWTSTTGHTYTRDPIPTDPLHRYPAPPRPTTDADAHTHTDGPPRGDPTSPIEAALRTALIDHAPPPF